MAEKKSKTERVGSDKILRFELGKYLRGSVFLQSRATSLYLGMRLAGGYDGENLLSREDALRIGKSLIEWGKTGNLMEVTNG